MAQIVFFLGFLYPLFVLTLNMQLFDIGDHDLPLNEVAHGKPSLRAMEEAEI